MGEAYSIPAADPNLQYMSINLRAPDTFTIIHGGGRETEAFRQAIATAWPEGIQEEHKLHGCFHIKLRGNPMFDGLFAFATDAVRFCRLACNIFQNLWDIGWEFYLSSDLTRCDQCTWFFKRRSSLDPLEFPMFCLAPYGRDKLRVINAPDDVIGVILQSIVSVWSRGIQKQYVGDAGEYVFKLNGYPSHNNDYEQSTDAIRLIMEMFSQLGRFNWTLYTATNLKGTCDSFFFRRDPEFVFDRDAGWLFAVYLNRQDRLRLINAPEQIKFIVRDAIKIGWPWGEPGENDKYKSWELKLPGYPWWATGRDAVKSRHTISLLLRRLQSQGWRVYQSLDISRKYKDKSMLMFKRDVPFDTPFFCLSLNETDKIEVIDAPDVVRDNLRGLIERHWTPGIQRLLVRENSYEFKLTGNPWSSSDDGERDMARSLLCHVLQELAGLQWVPVMSADVCAQYVEDDGPDYPSDSHSWWFMYFQNPRVAAAAAAAAANYYPSLSYGWYGMTLSDAPSVPPLEGAFSEYQGLAKIN